MGEVWKLEGEEDGDEEVEEEAAVPTTSEVLKETRGRDPLAAARGNAKPVKASSATTDPE